MSIGGSEGLFAQKTLEITDDILKTYKNQGRWCLMTDEGIVVIFQNLVHYLTLITMIVLRWL